MPYPEHSRPRPLVVIILDGWGVSFVHDGNAIAAAHTPYMDSYMRLYPSAAVQAASVEVGLPWGEVGNSETGHRNIGAGQVQYQSLPLIDRNIETGDFFKNEVLLGAVEHAKANNSSLHLMGLVSPGGVHSHMNHLFSLLELCAKENLKERVYIHMFTDGRDTLPQSALPYLDTLEQHIGATGVGTIGSVTGRFYAMDRNKNWERTEALYATLTGGKRKVGAPSAKEAINQAYHQNIFDEMIPPTAITRGGEPIATVKDNDACIFFNFRPDRARQLTAAFVTPEKVGFPTKPLQNIYFATLSQYDPAVPAPAAFIEESLEFPLARIVSDAGLAQLHIAETEKYAHITYYLNVGHEKPFPREQHIMIPSSDIQSFAQEPEMQAKAIAARVVEEVRTGAFDVVFINFANADMVGHTGDFAAAVKACETVDACIGQIQEAAFATGGALLVTADHGNAEEMQNPATGQRETDHTSNPVPLHYVHASLRRTTPKSDQELVAIFSTPIGVLADVAPTILNILQLPQPPSMTGVSLLSSLR
ncbi:MAG: 2,3-bisphosphoglycerate-independent phosphoglycerate mutase [Candidatus Andersenbacteria bacterium]